MARKRKPGPRYKGGKRRPEYDHGNERAREMRRRYGVHYTTPLGRLYAAGMLADSQQLATDRYQAGKRFSAVYSRILVHDGYRCPLDDTPRGLANFDPPDPDKLERDHDWLLAVMAEMDATGVRLWLDQCLSKAFTDHGPYWVERLLAHRPTGFDDLKLSELRTALDILCCGKRRRAA